MTAYIWDLDGTLLDSYGVIVKAAETAAADLGIRDRREDVLRAVKRGSLGAYFRDAAERTGVSAGQLMERYRLHTHAMDGLITLMDGAVEALDRLRDAGAEHYVYTHRGESSLPILERLGILDRFREVVTSVNGFPPKPSGDGVRYLAGKYRLDPEGTWYAGDRALDVLCAKDAGVKAVLLLPEDSPVIPTGLEDRIVRSLREL